MSSLDSLPWEDRVTVVRRHFEKKGYRVHSGLQFGCELVLYADDPDRVHSDFCVHVVRSDERLDWRVMQTLVRSMPELHKTLILANVKERSSSDDGAHVEYEVQELALGSEHAPFRHRITTKEVGGQAKKQKINEDNSMSDDIKESESR